MAADFCKRDPLVTADDADHTDHVLAADFADHAERPGRPRFARRGSSAGLRPAPTGTTQTETVSSASIRVFRGKPVIRGVGCDYQVYTSRPQIVLALYGR